MAKPRLSPEKAIRRLVPLWTTLALLVAGTATAGHKFPNVELTSHEGKVYRFQDDLIDGKVVVINFIYTECKNSCPAETARMKQVYRELDGRVGQDIQMYSISIDPELDTPERLREYMHKFKIGPGWQFFTGPKENTDRLRKALGLWMDDAVAEDDMDHNLSFIVGNARTGQWIKRSPFDDPKVLANLIGYGLFDGMISRGGKSYAVAPEVLQEHDGGYLFRTRCNSCHNLSGGDHELGPGLAGVTTKRTEAWLQSWLSDPSAMIDSGDPIALELYERYNRIRMPNLKLTPSDVAKLIDYLRIQDERLDAGSDGHEHHHHHHHSGHGDHQAQTSTDSAHGGDHAGHEGHPNHSSPTGGGRSS
jgi:protein SCO1/2